MTAAFTLILPHRRNPGNDASLAVCLSCLFDNTHNDFHLLIDAAVDEPLYPRVNHMIEQTDTECCVYWASDCFAAKDWDVPMLAAYDHETFVTPVLVEPGAIAMHSQNIHHDFGRKPETFRRAEFERWAATDANDLQLIGEGWVMPLMFSRQQFLKLGGWETDRTAPDGFTDADMRLLDRWKESGGRIVRVYSFVYHLQRFSDINEQQHEKRG